MPPEWIDSLTPAPTGQFQLPVAFDLCAVFFFALTGTLAAIPRNYDIVGLFAMALVSGLGGALIRDGLFLQNGPPALTKDGRYLIAVLAGALAGLLMGNLVRKFSKPVAVLDAIGLGAYGTVGVQKSLEAGLSVPAAILVGVINAAGGGLLRDIIIREEPLMMKPGQFYVLASLIGCVLFASMTVLTKYNAVEIALVSITATFMVRMMAIIFNWQTTALRHLIHEGEPAVNPAGDREKDEGVPSPAERPE